MITYRSLGRNGNTGNALFQYSTLLSVGKDRGYTVKIPYNPSYFDVNYNCNNLSLQEGFVLTTALLEPSDDHTITNNYSESTFHYNPDILDIKDNTNIVGYFQTEKYFVHNRQYILDNLRFKDEIARSAAELFTDLSINPTETTSMHVRRGDFIHKQHFHPLLPLEYYKAGVQETATKNSNCILVFSDDIDWCKQVFGGDRRIKYSTNKNPFVDMCAMSMCNNHIIGNSTFSWWGAWLNPNPTKIVVAPKGWFGLGYAHWTIKDLFPDSWIKL